MKNYVGRIFFSLVMLGLVPPVLAQVQVTGVDGATLSQIAGSETLVTVVLKGSGAEDANLKILSLAPTYFAALTEEDHRVVYLYESVSEVRVQGGVIEKPKLPNMGDQPLSEEEQQVVRRALERGKEIFDGANNDQELKIRAAVLLTLGNDEAALKYLHMLQQSNDLKTQLRASQALWLAGEATPTQLMKDGLRSGNREVRALAAILSGLNAHQDAVPVLYRMIQDRVAEISGPAAEALALLDDREIIPTLIELLKKPNEDKRMSAVKAFVQLGGDDVIERLKVLLKDADGLFRYNVALILYKLGDPAGKQDLVSIFEKVPTLEADVALVLARDGHPDAIQFLRTRLERREDPTDYNLLYKAENAASLIAGGEPSKKAVFQELLRMDNEKVVSRVFELIIENGDRGMMSLTKPGIENKNAKMSIAACEAAFALGNSKFRNNLMVLFPRQ